MKLSIVILSYNAAGLTLRCLDSLSPFLASNPKNEVVVVDNGSTDADLKKLIREKDYAGKERIKVKRLPENKGVAAGRNAGIRECDNESDYILLLDNDTIADSKAIEHLINLMDENPDIGIAAPRLVSPEGKIQTSFKPFPGLLEKIKNVLGRSNEAEPGKISEYLLQPFYVIGACQMIRHSLIREIGLLDDKIFFGPEDADYCMRARRAGKKVVYDPEVEIIHDWQRNSRKNLLSPVSRAHVRGLLYFYIKWRKFF